MLAAFALTGGAADWSPAAGSARPQTGQCWRAACWDSCSSQPREPGDPAFQQRACWLPCALGEGRDGCLAALCPPNYLSTGVSLKWLLGNEVFV